MAGVLSVSSQLLRFMSPLFFDAVSLVQLRCVHLFCTSLVAAIEAVDMTTFSAIAYLLR